MSSYLVFIIDKCILLPIPFTFGVPMNPIRLYDTAV
jgi:hypothetical protein